MFKDGWHRRTPLVSNVSTECYAASGGPGTHKTWSINRSCYQKVPSTGDQVSSRYPFCWSPRMGKDCPENTEAILLDDPVSGCKTVLPDL